MNDANILIISVLAIVILYVIFKCSKKDKFVRFGGPPFTSSCEFQPACLWDTARWVQLSNGMEGVCTLNGLACPSFSQDHDRIRTMGLSPTMVDDEYMRKLYSESPRRGNIVSKHFESYDYNPTSYQDSSGDYSEGFDGPDRPVLSGMYKQPLSFEEAFTQRVNDDSELRSELFSLPDSDVIGSPFGDVLAEGFNLYDNDLKHISESRYQESQSGINKLALGSYPTTTN
jgi:hypothetical protein